MASFTHFYRNSIFARVSINLVIFMLVYLAIVRPLRMQVTAKVVYPVLSALFNDATETSLSLNGLAVRMKFQGIDDKVDVNTPFGIFWGVPFVLLVSSYSRSLAKMLTYYHIAVAFVLPMLFSLFFMQSAWAFLPSHIFTNLTRFFGMIFFIFALKRIYYER